jgi:plastocyanin
MNRTLLIVIAALVSAATLAGTAFGRHAAVPKLVGTVGPGYTIHLMQKGKVVKTLKAGTYTFVVHDKSSIHGFSMDGPNGFDKDFTKVPAVGTKTLTVKLKAGTYKYYCPAHESMMFAHFTVK